MSSMSYPLRWPLALVCVFTLFSAAAPFASAQNVQVDPNMSTQDIQNAMNGAPYGATISFAAGTYNITATLTIPCANLQLTGPVSTPPTAILAASYTNNPIFIYTGACMNLGSVMYLGFLNTGAAYFGGGDNGNLTFEYNSVGNLPSNMSNNTSESGLFFDGDLNTKLTNILVQYNTFGDDNSCAAVFADVNDNGGYCAGIITSQGENNNIDIEYNVFNHVEEGIHFNQMASYNPGQPNSVCVTCKVDYNYVVHYHRIGIEIQVSTPTDSIMLEHNAVVDPLNSSWGTFAVSLACCQSGYTIGQDGFSPGFVFNDNVLISSQPPGSEPPPYGVEFWGNGSQGTNSLVEGNFSNGYTWGWGAGAWAINNNYICGPNYLTQGGYISNQQGQSNPPSQSGNVTAAECQTTPSTAPTITPSGGSYTTSQVVTMSDSGANTATWCTTDGSDPVPGSGTATIMTSYTLRADVTLKCVGMWGAANQPSSYPSGYGYVPSSVVTNSYTVSGNPTVTSGYLGNPGSVNQVPVNAGPIQFTAYVTYSNNTQGTLPDSYGNTAVWSSSNSSILAVGSTGLVSCIAGGSANVQVNVNTSSGLRLNVWTMTCTTPADPTITGGYLGNPGSVNTLAVGASPIQFTPYVTYSNSAQGTLPDSYGNTAVWSSSNSAVLSVGSSGAVSCVATGSANVQVNVNSASGPRLNVWTMTCTN